MVRRPSAHSRIVIGSILVAVLASGAATAAYVWGPLHDAYELACRAYPPLRAIGPVPLAMVATGIVAGFLAGSVTLLGELAATRRFGHVAAHAEKTLPSRLEALGQRLGLIGQIKLVEDAVPYAFCRGQFRPTIYLSTGLLKHLDDGELRAVLLHERAHLQHRDPLRFLLARVLSRMLFLVPVYEEWYRTYRTRRELQADQDALGSTDIGDLSAALLKLLRAQRHSRPLDAVARFGDIEARIEQLEHGRAPTGPGVPWDRGIGHIALRTGTSLLMLGVLANASQEAVLGCLI